ncbi:MAG: hypothetical protein AB8I08_08440 [Sandaracinaceae bacterium]
MGCDTGETCSFDAICEGLAVVVPDSWTCELAYFGTGDGCDCECGGDDPDCANPDAELFNCDEGQVCRTGVCEAAAGGDAGPAGIDAGRPSDGGAPAVDGGMESGGGGCRAAPGRGAPGVLLLLGGALSVLLRRRRFSL